ncbi:MAG: tripartite tricarboxylate transporter substrate binding protein [Proteobacteria bacterium]|nr:tripartite tricarboxylate transporter substrate binding protein [Pseudomonadota bacterium]
MLRRSFAALSLAALSARAAYAQGDKVSKLVIGFPAGQATDIIARLLAEGLREETGDTVIVENKPGQGGSIALSQVTRAAPDGSTYILSPMAALVINPHLYKNVAYDTLTGFEPVGRVGDLPLVMVVHPSLPVKTLPELIAYAKANPDKLSHPSSGIGTVSHVAMEELKARAGIHILHVPYQGSPPAMNDLIAGRVQVAMDTIAVTRPHIEAGRMRLIAVGTLQRLKFFPDTPTIAEQGFPGFEATTWLAVLLPAHAPAEKVQRLSDALARIVNRPDMEQKFLAAGTLPHSSTSAEFATFLKSEDARWSAVIAQSGIRAD